MTSLNLLLAFAGCIITFVVGTPINAADTDNDAAPLSWTHGHPHLTHVLPVPAVTPTKPSIPGHTIHHDHLPFRPPQDDNDKRAEEIHPTHPPTSNFNIRPNEQPTRIPHPPVHESVQVSTVVDGQVVYIPGANTYYKSFWQSTITKAGPVASPASKAPKETFISKHVNHATPTIYPKPASSLTDEDNIKQANKPSMVTRPYPPGKKTSTQSHEFYSHPSTSSRSTLPKPTPPLNSVSHVLITRPHPPRSEDDGSVLLATPFPPSDVVSKCTMTLFKPTPFMLGPTSTAYVSTYTHTSFVRCQSCALAVERGGPGPVVHYTTTATVAAVKTAEAFACVRHNFITVEGGPS